MKYYIRVKPRDEWFPVGAITSIPDNKTQIITPNARLDLECDGLALWQHEYPELFDLIGYDYTDRHVRVYRRFTWFKRIQRKFGFNVPMYDLIDNPAYTPGTFQIPKLGQG